MSSTHWMVRLAITLLLAVGPPAVYGKSSGATPPNIVLILTDDLGWGDLACHGNPVIETPHIDDMLDAGGELTRFYVSPVCSPTRASLMTGRYNYRTRVIDTYRGHSMMDTEEVTVAELLRTAGYATGIFGKWHLGDAYPLRPQDQGFEQTVVFHGGGLCQPTDPPDNRGVYTNPTLWRNGEKFVADGYCTDVFFGEALEFIQQSVADERPFFAYISTNAPHGPYHDVPVELYEKYKKKEVSQVVYGDAKQVDRTARTFAMIENIDENVGKLRAELKEMGLAENTVVIFMSDNGPQEARYVGERRGTKGEVLEGGILSPFIVEWPGQVRPGHRDDRVAAHIDVLPTLLEIADATPPTDLNLDGRSVVPLLVEQQADWPERSVVIQSHRGAHPVEGHNMAVVGQQWKLVRPSGFGRFYPKEDAPFQLYNLASDPRESNNLGDEQPEVFEQLRNRYRQWFADVSSTRPDNYEPPRMVIGSHKQKVATLTWQDWQPVDEGWGSQGDWLLQAEAPGVMDVEAVFLKPVQGDLTLALGDQVVHQHVEAPAKVVFFREVLYPAGEFAARCEHTQDPKAKGPYHLRLIEK
ncbi:arylsulfatase [Aeoliella sp. ICT_H6.2]|uniref:Arylsulfatase n=1 Tax=Aeoliella straminimaris TaxID=2954799 RepID=A0A9X2F7F3_9BACT|nr:arylsulfatase [Aeoliella straminimaris]